MSRLILALPVLAATCGGPVPAATMATWHGATENACAGRCGVEWAASALPEDARQAAEAAMAEAPSRFVVPEGAVVTHMAYFKAGAPHMDTRGTVIDVEGGAPAEGWDIGPWLFVKLDDCTNWSLVQKGESVKPISSFGGGSASPDMAGRGSHSSLSLARTTGAAVAGSSVLPPLDGGTHPLDTTGGPQPTPEPATLTETGISQSAIYLLTAVFMGWSLARGKRDV